MQYHQQLPTNTTGRDFVVGDIHGHFEALFSALSHIRFDFNNDRLLAVGDLVDRGPDSFKVIQLLAQPWFHSVLGNHEQLLLSAFYNDHRISLHRGCGGDWFYELSSAEKQKVVRLIESQMPLALEVNTPLGKIGLIHAQSPADWSLTKTAQIEHQMHELLWKKHQYSEGASQGYRDRIANIDYVFHGHVSLQKPERYGNQAWIDTFAKTSQFTVQPLFKVQP